VRAVEMPTHVFIEMVLPGGQSVDVETTSANGYGLTHDEEFFRQQAASFSSNRGLRPLTVEDYRDRTVVDVASLVARAMVGQTRDLSNEEDKTRLFEAAAIVAPADRESRLRRILAYVHAATALREQKDSPSARAMFDCVEPVVAEAGRSPGEDAELANAVSWARWSYADALQNTGRGAEAIAMCNAALDRFDEGWEDAATLRTNYAITFNERMLELMGKDDHAAAVEVVARHPDVCVRDEACAHNLGTVYANWSVRRELARDFIGASRALEECLSRMPGGSVCAEAKIAFEGRRAPSTP
jgi:hypothetical protein